jgi:hypothetical protein
MTPRLDAGDIVLRRTVQPGDDDPVALRARLLRDAVPVLADFIERVRRCGTRGRGTAGFLGDLAGATPDGSRQSMSPTPGMGRPAESVRD